MRFGLTRFFRRARRTRFGPPLSTPTTRAKHVKIDDEERHGSSSEEDSYHYNTTYQFLRRGGPSRTRVTGSRRSRRRRRMLRTALLTLLGLFGVLVALAYIIYKPPAAVIRFLQWKYPTVLFHVPLPLSPSATTSAGINRKVIALTLDDAPSDQTPAILDLLKEYDAHATFFVIGGQVAEHPGLLERMRAEGHELANHAWADEPSIGLPLSELERQLGEVQRLLLDPADDDHLPDSNSAVRPSPKYFRPGSGFFNHKMVDLAARLGYRLVLGSIFPHDPNFPHPAINAAHVLSMLTPGGIVIMHDRRSYSPRQLELVLQGMRARGWEARTVTGLLTLAAELNDTSKQD